MMTDPKMPTLCDNPTPATPPVIVIRSSEESGSPISNSTSETNRSAQALHRVLVKARYLAIQGESSERLAAILDWAELLAQDIAANEDGDEFAEHLQGLGDDHPEFAGLFRDYRDGCL